ncbi:MAG: carbohydrate ABC transporter permease [Ignisphaera sp.]|uniref:Carbohydrate ABC transporter permease n=1 Tax=Ignisphaera aggregans TaxID=334771 RepID=A0A7J3JRF3_9CREN
MELRIVSKALKYIVIGVFALWTLVPLTWIVSLAFKSYAEWRVSYFVPKNPTVDNFVLLFKPQELLGKYGVMGATAIIESATKPLLNSLVVTVAATVLSVFVGFFTAYGASRYRAPGPFTLFFTLLTRMLPPAIFITPIMVYYSNLGMLDTYFGLVFLYSAVTVTYAIWILKGFIDAIPVEWEEAAMLEGATPTKVLFRVVLPLVRPGLVVAGLFIFLLTWSELLFALVLTNINAVTLSVHISKYVGAVGQLFGPQAALALIGSIIPVVIGYAIQKHLVTGFTFGMVRG